MPHLRKKIYLQTWSAYLSKRSKRKLYPCHILKSSSSVWDTSLESFRKQDSPANISTISKGERSSDCCMFWTHVERHSFSENILKGEKMFSNDKCCAFLEMLKDSLWDNFNDRSRFQVKWHTNNYNQLRIPLYIKKETQMLRHSHNFLILEC